MGPLATHPLTAFIEGLMSPWRGLAQLRSLSGLRGPALWPLLINMVLWLLVFVGLLWGIWHWEIPNVDWTWWAPLGSWMALAVNGLGELGKWLLLPVFFVIGWFAFTSVGFVLASPFNDVLSARLEEALCQTAQRPALTTTQTLRSVVDSLRIVGRQILWTAGCLPLLLVPGIGALPLFLVTAHFTGLGCLEAALARGPLRESHKRLGRRQLRWQLLGLGTALELLFLIPAVGMFVMPMGVCAATWFYCRLDWGALFKDSGHQPPENFPLPRLN